MKKQFGISDHLYPRRLARLKPTPKCRKPIPKFLPVLTAPERYLKKIFVQRHYQEHLQRVLEAQRPLIIRHEYELRS